MGPEIRAWSRGRLPALDGRPAVPVRLVFVGLVPLVLLLDSRRLLAGVGRHVHRLPLLAGLEGQDRLVRLAAGEVRLVGDKQLGAAEGDAGRGVERNRGVVRPRVLLTEARDLLA